MVVALLASILSMLTAWFSYRAKVYSEQGVKDAKRINRAVNGRDPGEKSLIELVIETNSNIKNMAEWRESYKDSPWKDGENVLEWISHNDRRIERIHGRIDDVEMRSSQNAQKKNT